MSNIEFEYSEDVETIDLEEIDNFLENIKTKPSKKPSSPSPKLKQTREKADKLNIEIMDTHENSDLPEAKLSYRLKNKKKENAITEVNGKWICPFCRTLVKNINLHFSKNLIAKVKLIRSTSKLYLLTLQKRSREKRKTEKAKLSSTNELGK